MTCSNCERKEWLASLDVESLIEEQLSLETNLANENTVAKRRAFCSKCKELSQHTCIQCGCFVEFRIHLKEKSCPLGKWEKEVS